MVGRPIVLVLLLLSSLALTPPADADADVDADAADAGNATTTKTPKRENKLKKLQKQIKQLTESVAFTAQYSDNYHIHLKKDEPLVLGTVMLDVGGGYDNNTGTFTAPRAGLYHLSLHALCWANAKEHFIELKVQCDSRNVLLAGSWCPQGSGTPGAGNAVAVKLRRGAECRVLAAHRSGMAVYQAGRASTTTFTGHLIAATTPDD